MKTHLKYFPILMMFGLMGCSEENDPYNKDKEVEIEMSPTYIEVINGANVSISYKVKAPDGLAIIQSAIDANWSVVKQFSGEEEFEGTFSIDAFIYDVGIWESSIKDSIQVAIYAEDLDGDVSYKRSVVKILSP